MYVVGIDENGLGPRLGPLVVTGVVIEAPTYETGRLRRRGIRLGITDSKESSGFGRMTFAEGIALAIVARMLGRVPAHVDDVLSALSLDGPMALRAPCPDDATARQCHHETIALPAYGGDAKEGEDILRRLEGRDALRVRRVRSVLACVGVLNRELAAGRTKLAVDLALMERLLLDARAFAEAELHAVCGMVGGIRDYPKFARHIPFTAFREDDCDGSRTAYRVDGVGRVAFEIDADANHLPVALASMVGKYIREITMHRIARFYMREDETLPAPSGYYDPVTARFIEGTHALRRRLAIVEACFQRGA